MKEEAGANSLDMANKFKILQNILLSGLVLLSLCAATDTVAAIPSGKTTVVYFGTLKAQDFNDKVKPVFEENARPCKSCELVNLTPYSKDGSVDMAALQEKLDALPSDTSFVYFDFNTRVTEENKELVSLLSRKINSGLVVVGTAGAPNGSESSGPLSRTILGQAHGALIIGELAERDRLTPSAFYGPEMLTALRPPRGQVGQGYSPLIFAANLAGKWNKRNSQEWMEHFRTKKMKSRKIWLDLNDLF